MTSVQMVATPVSEEEPPEKDCVWILDSTCSQTIVNDKSLLRDSFFPKVKSVTLADGSQVEIMAQGNVYVPSLGTIIPNALCVPRINYCLLSCLLYTSPSPRD